MNAKETGCGDVDWSHLTEDKVQQWAALNIVMIS
jgi:hypothetical protein